MKNRIEEPTEDDCPIEKIEISFAIPTYLRDTDFRQLHDLVNAITQRPVNQLLDGVHWLASYGHKPKWSQADCEVLGKTPDAGAPEMGEPTYDNTIHSMETASRRFTSCAEKKRHCKEYGIKYEG